jgi:hypothetical protein
MKNTSPYHALSHGSTSSALTRRELLARSGCGFGSMALAAMLAGDRDAVAAGTAEAGVSLHPACIYPPKVKRVVQLFMAGAASHIDLWDYKPDLVKHHGKPSDFGEPVEAFQNGLGPWLKPIWDFKPYGQSGKLLSTPVAALGDVVDQMAFIHNMVSTSGVHSAATLLQTTGFVLPGFPGAGCWVSYALGSMNDNLPTFVVLPDHRGYGSNGVKNWDAGFLPSQYSGTVVQPAADEPLADLRPHKAATFVSGESDAAARDLIGRLNRHHLESHAGDSRLEARIQSYELAAKMQMAAPEALDLASEPEHVLKLYGLDRARTSWPSQINAEEETHHFGLRCLAARRLLERGVRFVQIFAGRGVGGDGSVDDVPWDGHSNIETNHRECGLATDRPAAALLADLKARGLLEDTLVIWGGEFGRTSDSQGGKGRDHNPGGFTLWMAGGGVKGGFHYGSTDPFGYKAIENKVHVNDLHATLLHLLGIDHEKLTYRHNGRNFRLTDVGGHVISDVIA